MKQLIPILLLLLPLCVFAQSKESKQLYKQGMALFDAEKYEEALPYFQQSDSLDKAQLNPSHKKYYRAELAMADCYEELAIQADDEGHYKEALHIQKNVVEIRKKALGEEHPDYANALRDLAVDYEYNGNYTEAIRLGTIAMKTQKKVLGEEHPDYAESLNNLALYYDDIGNYTEAIRLRSVERRVGKECRSRWSP
jgi:tetratricopeptide (TPR) repeat protein